MKFNCSNGYVLNIKTLCPYYLDFIDQVCPYIPHPKRKITLLAGDVIEVDYKLPQSPPDELDEDYDLYYSYVSVVEQNEERKKLRDALREDFLLLQCIHVVEGPTKYTDTEWEEELNASIGLEVPTSSQKRRLYHLKYCVIQLHEKNDIMNMCLYKEVSMADISNAVESFRN